MYQQFQNGRQQFAANGIDTASNHKILIMCFDRVDLDLNRALAAVESHDTQTAHDNLTHAQDLISELALMLDENLWEHASSLLAVYDYLLRILAVANMMKTTAPIVEAQQIVKEIGDGFRQAAKAAAAQVAQTSNSFNAGSAEPGSLSVQA